MIPRIAYRALPALVLVLVLVVPIHFFPAVPGMPVHAANMLNIVPSAGVPYTPVTLTIDAGTFTSGTTVTAGFQDAAGNPSQPVGTGTAAANGSATLSGLIPFSAAVGNGSITVTGTLTGTPVSLHGVFLVRPVIQLTPDHAAAGSSLALTVYGNGFDADSHVIFSENGVPISGVSAQTGPDGSFPSLSIPFVVPTSGTAVLIGAGDASGAQAQAVIAIDSGSNASPTPSPTSVGVIAGAGLTINPSAGPPGLGNVAISSAAGAFSGLSSVALSFTDHAGNALSLPPVPVSATGAVSASITLPGQAAGGVAIISAQAPGFATLIGPFQISPTVSFSPTVVPPGGSFSVIGDGFTPLATVSFMIGGVTASSTVPITVGTTGHFAMSFTLPTSVPLGPTTFAATDSAGVGPVQAAFTVGTPAPPPTVTASPIPTPSGTTGAVGTTNVYFAEGYTGQAATNKAAGFTETLTMLNPLPTAAVVTITYFSQDGSPPVAVSRTIPPTSSFSDSVNADVGADRIVSAEVQSSQRIFVTRTIDRTSPTGARLDGSTSLPTTAPALIWGFPEGYTGITFQEYLTILNPSTVPATVTVTLAPQSDSALGARVSTVAVPAQSRRTVNIRALNQGDHAQSVGMLVSSTVPIVAERVEYFGDGAGSGKFGSTVSPGIAAPATQLRFPVLSSGGSAPNSLGVAQPISDQAYITILNPALSGSPVQVAAAFTSASGASLGPAVTVDVPPGTRRTITVNTSVGSNPVGPVSAVLNASGPIEAEAAQYVGGSPNTGPHPGVGFAGAPGTTTDAFLTNLGTTQADGTAIIRSLFIFNSSASPEQIAATYFGANSAETTATYTVGAGDILTINVNQATQILGTVAALGAELRMTRGAPVGFLVDAAGLTVDSLAATEDAGSPN